MSVICPRFDDLGMREPGARVDLGLMGGTFDPVHIGHLACAEQVRCALGLDAVVFIPANVQPYKRGTRVTKGALRLQMCQLATAANPRFDVSPIEVDRGGDTFTAETLRQLRAHYPDNVRFHFITGADAVLSIAKWRDSADIARLARIVAVTRPGYEVTPQDRSIIERAGFDVTYFEMTALSVSSSMLRAWVAQGRSIRYLTALPVVDFIESHGLYRDRPEEA